MVRYVIRTGTVSNVELQISPTEQNASNADISLIEEQGVIFNRIKERDQEINLKKRVIGIASIVDSITLREDRIVLNAIILKHDYLHTIQYLLFC